METKKITLRSQTVQCPHCGEYYSVTYKYCPFCDAGRQEEERKLAEKKKKKQAFFGNLFGSHEPEKKKTPIRWNWTARTRSVHCGRKALGSPGAGNLPCPESRSRKRMHPRTLGRRSMWGRSPCAKRNRSAGMAPGRKPVR